MKIAFTVATPDYLVQSKVLGHSFLLNNPSWTFVIGLIGDKNALPDIDLSAFRIVTVGQLSDQFIGDMLNRYKPFELSCALKPFFAEYLFDKWDAERLIYLDSDIYVWSSFHKVDEILDGAYSIVLTPHYTSSESRNDHHLADLMMLNYGLYNAGFFALKRSGPALNMLQWWKDKMITECVEDLCSGRFVDQIWLNLIPLYFEGVMISTDEGYNAAPWNLCERSISLDPQRQYLVNGATRLVFFHYSGYKPEYPSLLSKNHPAQTFITHPEVKSLFEIYSDNLTANGYKIAVAKQNESPHSSTSSLGKQYFYRLLRKLK